MKKLRKLFSFHEIGKILKHKFYVIIPTSKFGCFKKKHIP
ncbi:hypothetical protein LEP1GSC059_3446 [Leptospira noguchii serovar Panama str. CZ214]|uniref:Uncharacterized protein n=1 Tax=Leptospira noguchii serovar Panama str. CZ214 TaxID=1001595 RepID=T0GU63_9LEPT|nr:hypothetical protein LEP1GSC059_3446 [Leptospira noguchii serovar Panama str. CZ214]